MALSVLARDQRYRTSRQLFEAAQAHLSGGTTRLTLATRPHPIYLAEGQGCHATDVDGNRYVDFTSNFASLIHGHAHPEVMASVAQVLQRGRDRLADRRVPRRGAGRC